MLNPDLKENKGLKLKIFLKLKHWQLFLIYLIINRFSVSLFIQKNELTNSYSIINIIGIFALILPEIFILNWVFWIGHFLFIKIESSFKYKELKYKYFILALQIIVIYFFIGILSNFLSLLHLTFNNIYVVLHNFIIITITIVSILSFIYTMYFIAKSLQTVLFNKEVTFNDFKKEFFLLIILPVGIWFIQPKINKLFNEEN